MTVGEMLERMDSAEMAEWIAYAQVDPFGSVRSDLQAGVIASTVANVNRDTKKRKKPFEPSDFVIAFERKPKPTQAQLLEKVQTITRLLGHTLAQGN